MYTFGQRNLVVTDVELGKLITIRDADYFVDRSAWQAVLLLLPHKQKSEPLFKIQILITELLHYKPSNC